MKQLTDAERKLIAPIDQAALLAQTERWSAINSGSGNLAGLERQATELATAFSVLPGEVTALEAPKLPHIGWNRVALERPAGLTAGLGEAAAFYHVHSFVCRPREDGDVVGRGEYGERFASIVERDNVAGVQFHPEKSSRDGLALLANFVAAA
jgi:glutamine amidotransferase